MRRIIITCIISALIVSVAAIFGVRHYTQASSPVTAYDADVNHDGRITIGDLAKVAYYFGQTAPLPTPTSTPYLYAPGSGIFESGTIWCTNGPGDIALGWGGQTLDSGNLLTAAPVSGGNPNGPGLPPLYGWQFTMRPGKGMAMWVSCEGNVH